MKAWWQGLNLREQRLVGSLVLVGIVFLLYSSIWQPLNENLAKAEKKIVRQQALLSWVNENTARYQLAQKNGGDNQSKGSISSIVNRSANQFQLTITRMQPQGDELQVWLDEVSYSQLLFWLAHLASQEGLQVKAIDLTKSEQTGVVQVRRLQLSKA